MKLPQVLNYINQALNYPSITYDDVSLFFDSAIVEINSSLHIKMPLVSVMINEFLQYMSNNNPNKVLLTAYPEDTDTFPIFSTIEDALVTSPKYAYFSSLNKFGILNAGSKTYTLYPNLYGIFRNSGVPVHFKAVKFSQTDIVWVIDEDADPTNFEFNHYLPDSWVLLWMIPYVCYKYTVRDGGTAANFAEELTQGFQQLQNAYDIPSTVVLSTVAGRPAYSELTKLNLDNLNIKVPTRAIYENMQHERSLNATYGNMYDRGGFLYD